MQSPQRSSSVLAAVLAAIVLSILPRHPSAATAYDTAAAATRNEYRIKAAHCKTLGRAARIACIKAAKAEAQGALGNTYAQAMAAAKASHASASAKCKSPNRAERRRCLRSAKAEYRMALGRAEEIRSAPLAMGAD
jgi:hypothetical protein